MTTATSRRIKVLVALAATAALGLTAAHVGDVLVMLAQLAPAILLFAVFSVGRFPGERRLVGALPSRRPRRCAPALFAPKDSTQVKLVRGGELLGSLAGRAPPRGLCIA
jgi:hypothetical protein